TMPSTTTRTTTTAAAMKPGRVNGFCSLSSVAMSELRSGPGDETDERDGGGDDDDATEGHADLADVLPALAATRLDRHERARCDDAEDAHYEADPLGPTEDGGDRLGARRLRGCRVGKLRRDHGGEVARRREDAVQGAHRVSFRLTVPAAPGRTTARRSSTSRRTSRGASESAGGSPKRHASIHGRVHVRGTPPPTICENSRSGRGSRPGASATITRPTTSTCGTRPDAHCVAATCAARSPRMFDRAVSTTRTPLAPGIWGQACSAAGQSGTRAASDVSPAPPCTPSHHRGAA